MLDPLTPSALEMSMSDGRTQKYELPTEGTISAQRTIDEIADSICEEYGQRGRIGQGRSERNRWLRPICYTLFTHCHGSAVEPFLGKRIQKNGRFSRGSAETSNRFQWYLLGVFASEKGMLDERQRSSLGMEMWYTYRHFVPTCLVNAFSGGIKDLTLEKCNSSIEEGFEDWIVGQSGLSVRNIAYRGHYPQQILERIKRNPHTLGEFINSLAWSVNESKSFNEG